MRLDTRVAKLEADVSAIKADVAFIISNYATKADLDEMSASLVKWVVGTAAALGAVAITVIAFVLKNAVPKVATASPTPIIITIPAPVAVPAPAR
jgi:hypothetical protein